MGGMGYNGSSGGVPGSCMGCRVKAVLHGARHCHHHLHQEALMLSVFLVPPLFYLYLLQSATTHPPTL